MIASIICIIVAKYVFRCCSLLYLKRRSVMRKKKLGIAILSLSVLTFVGITAWTNVKYLDTK